MNNKIVELKATADRREAWKAEQKEKNKGKSSSHAAASAAIKAELAKAFPHVKFYNPKTFIIHAAWLRQAFAHCARFPTAASRRSLDRVSVPV